MHDEQNETTDCCIVGAGPAGLVLALLLARAGVAVTLLEAHQDFERQFRGNTVSPAMLELLDDIGLTGRLRAMPHAQVQRFVAQTEAEQTTFADFSLLPSQHPYLLMLPQARLLELLAAEARRFPHLTLHMGTTVVGLLKEDDQVQGVRYRHETGEGEVRARLTVAADGRFSRVRRLAGLELTPLSSAMDVLWFTLPRAASDPADTGAIFRFGPGCLLALMDHGNYWQVGYIIKKGGYQALRAAGLEALQRNIASAAPELSERVHQLRSWHDCALLSVETSGLQRWYAPGLLLTGDAAHPMSPVGGVGITLAVQDAVAAANMLAQPLRQGHVKTEHLAAIQRQRQGAVRFIQRCQVLAQNWVVRHALDSAKPFRLPCWARAALRLRPVRRRLAQLIAYGGITVSPRRTRRERRAD
ncbi:MAG: FAD-dependent oxidoreductase, partial [Chloroflexaceae bacterium]|nr:FAD-dependent oxidoreductase [Chloroflexaceae bacterium]